MRRASLALVLLAAVAAIAAAVLVSTGGGSSYKVAAIFDTANGMVSGQQVKIAGAVVGSVESIDLGAGGNGYKARIVMSVDKRFAPFRADARCTILPEGLISENFVECNPGRAAAPLPRGAAGVPTVPLAQTSVPFSLQDVLNVLSLPTDERLSVLISELGIGTAGRGQDINALLRRTNPALQQSQRVLQIVDAQRAQVATAVDQTNQVLSSLAARSGQVREFVDRAATVAQTTAAHSGALGQAVARFPAMLAAVRPGLRALNRAATNATPLLGEVHAAAPGLSELMTTLPAFARAGIPALRTLASAAAAGRPAVRDAVPVINHLAAVTGPLNTLGTLLSPLLVSSRNEGAFEGLLLVVYAFANNLALEDNVSHMVTFMIALDPACIAGQEGGFNVTGCAHQYNSPAGGELPINEPSCGPRIASWMNEFCPPATPGPITLARRGTGSQQGAASSKLFGDINTVLSGGSVARQNWEPLLNFLLK
jgi:virulence factor Mce-like protein